MSEELVFEDMGGSGRAEVIRLRGRLDARTAPLLIERCANARDAGRNLVLNLRDVQLLSSSGAGSTRTRCSPNSTPLWSARSRTRRYGSSC